MAADTTVPDVRPPAARVTRTLRAGPLTMLFEDGRLHYLRYGAREVLRRIYVAVRDATWGTAINVLSDVDIDDRGDAFVVKFVARCERGAVRFEWHGHIEGSANGRVVYRMEGEALADFQSNRIGICVLHPIDECRGRPCEVETVDGAKVNASFPETIHPHLPFANLRALCHEVEPGVTATVRLEGDTFETEDQRQWGDASYKTYSRPQALPKPFDVAAGSWVVQTMVLELEGQSGEPTAYASLDEVRIAVDAASPCRLPEIGLVLPAGAPSHAGRDRERLAALGLHHLRLDLVPVRAESHDELARAVDEARALGVPLDLALYLSRSPSRELSRLAQLLEQLNPRLSGVSIATLIDDVPTADMKRMARKTLSHVVPDVAVGVAVHPHFTQLNRHREVAEGAKFLSVPFWPAVHTDDERTLMENLATPRWIRETAQSFASDVPLHMGPIALRKQPRPGAGEQVPANLVELPAHVDARQATAFLAGWAALHIAVLAEAGVRRASYFQTRGWLGVMPGGAGLPPGFAHPDAGVFPVHHVLADIGEVRDAQVLPARSSAPLEVGALVLRRGRDLRVLLVNLGARTRRVTLQSDLDRGWLRRLDGQTVLAAVTDPEAFRATSPQAWDGTPIALGPGEIARLDGLH